MRHGVPGWSEGIFVLLERIWDEQVNDISLEDYIAVKAKFATFVPHTAGRYQKKRFRKAQCPITERSASSDIPQVLPFLEV